MLLVRATTKGLVCLDFSHMHSNHFGVVIGIFDSDGWMDEMASWGPYDEDKNRVDDDQVQPMLAGRIAEAVEMPEAEAGELAESALRQWRERGGEDERRGDALKGLAFITVAGTGVSLAIAAAIAALGFIVVLLIKLA